MLTSCPLGATEVDVLRQAKWITVESTFDPSGRDTCYITCFTYPVPNTLSDGWCLEPAWAQVQAETIAPLASTRQKCQYEMTLGDCPANNDDIQELFRQVKAGDTLVVEWRHENSDFVSPYCIVIHLLRQGEVVAEKGWMMPYPGQD